MFLRALLRCIFSSCSSAGRTVEGVGGDVLAKACGRLVAWPTVWRGVGGVADVVARV